MNHPKILIIEDHPLITEGYRSTLTEIEDYYIFSCNNAASAKEILEKTEFDLIMLDLNLADSIQKQKIVGYDLAIWIRKMFPSAKLLIITSHEEKCLIYDIVKNIVPNGFLIKSDCSSSKLKECLVNVFCGNNYFDTRVKSAIADINKSDVLLDNINRQILSLLDQGVLTKNMPEHLPLSLSAIDKRKAIIRDLFGLKKSTDQDLLQEARNRGFI
jgi:two-component system response regulator NreC